MIAGCDIARRDRIWIVTRVAIRIARRAGEGGSCGPAAGCEGDVVPHARGRTTRGADAARRGGLGSGVRPGQCRCELAERGDRGRGARLVVLAFDVGKRGTRVRRFGIGLGVWIGVEIRTWS